MKRTTVRLLLGSFAMRLANVNASRSSLPPKKIIAIRNDEGSANSLKYNCLMYPWSIRIPTEQGALSRTLEFNALNFLLSIR
ncbi:hypothetical protein SLA2020_518680 [Shorea laevis]